MIVAGDIGGTKTLLAIFDAERGPREPQRQAEYRSAAYPSLDVMVAEFLHEHADGGAARPQRGSFAVAGPVAAGRVQATNLSWPELSEDGLASALGLEGVSLLNDLQAVALGITVTTAAELVTLAVGQPVPGAPIAVIAPGTGLGEAFLTRRGTTWAAHASEGGHADFAPRDELEVDLLRFLLPRFGHVSYEQVCSGVGIPNLYDFFAQRGTGEEPAMTTAELAGAEDRTRAIVGLGLGPRPRSTRCREVVGLFTRILGSEAGNLALKVLATGGVYLTGGLAVAVAGELSAGPFLERLRSKGRMSSVLAEVPVHVVTAPAALHGAAVEGLRAEGLP
ncbi:MAG: glucokinase [Acidimicrobiia bacterium]|nr:glucokinase [Acidimicrobiia bacterium]